MRLLIAEDERDLAEALSVFFEKNQFTVDTVYNGFNAYEYAVTGDYDAIVLDVMMPKLNGVEVLERLRAEGVRTPVMMLTAKAEKDDRITGFNAGADDYLGPPAGQAVPHGGPALPPAGPGSFLPWWYPPAFFLPVYHRIVTEKTPPAKSGLIPPADLPPHPSAETDRAGTRYSARPGEGPAPGQRRHLR